MGCSPYYATTGTHPLIPLDIIEATYLLPPPDSILSATDLIAHHAIALQKRNSDLACLHSTVYKERVKAVIAFEKKHFRMICDFDFKQNELVLMHNTKIKYALNKKMKPRYDGPFIVISRNRRHLHLVSIRWFHLPQANRSIQIIALPCTRFDLPTRQHDGHQHTEITRT